MGLLVGLPLKLFHILFVVLRVAWPILLILLIRFLLRRWKTKGSGWQASRDEPDFDGPVVEVDYTVVDEEETGDGEG